MKKINYSHFFWVLFYFFIFCLLLRHSLSYLDPDLGWHLRVGQEISQTLSVPKENLYNYTYTGNWVDHEWLSNFLLYKAYDGFGYVFLATFFSLIIVSVLILLNIKVRNKYPNSDFLIIIFELFGLIASLPHFGIRVQEIGILLVLFIFIIIDNFNRTKNWRVLLILPIVFYFWACLHASFIIGLFLMGAWAAVKLLEIYLNRFPKINWLDFSHIIRQRELIIFCTIFVLAIIATLFTPYRVELYSFLLGYRDNYYLLHVVEWLPQYTFPLKYWQLFYLSFLTGIIILNIFYVFVLKKTKINLWSLFIAFLFLYLGLKSRRHFPLMFVSTFVFIFDFVYLGRIINKKESFLKFDRGPLGIIIKISLASGLILAICLQLLSTNFTSKPFDYFCNQFPCGATDFLKRNERKYGDINLYNYYAWGGYLNWVIPERKIFIDGRLPQVKFAGHSFLEEYYDFFRKDSDLPKKLSDYNIGLILLPVGEDEIVIKKWEKFLFKISDKSFKNHNYLREKISQLSGWSKIYEDSVSVIYLKND